MQPATDGTSHALIQCGRAARACGLHSGHALPWQSPQHFDLALPVTVCCAGDAKQQAARTHFLLTLSDVYLMYSTRGDRRQVAKGPAGPNERFTY